MQILRFHQYNIVIPDTVTASSVEVVMNIYDFNGNVIKSLINGNLPAGDNFAVWDFTYNNNNTVPPGFYIVAARNFFSYVHYAIILKE